MLRTRSVSNEMFPPEERTQGSESGTQKHTRAVETKTNDRKRENKGLENGRLVCSRSLFQRERRTLREESQGFLYRIAGVSGTPKSTDPRGGVGVGPVQGRLPNEGGEKGSMWSTFPWLHRRHLRLARGCVI